MLKALNIKAIRQILLLVQVDKIATRVYLEVSVSKIISDLGS